MVTPSRPGSLPARRGSVKSVSMREIIGPPLPDVPFQSVPQLIAARAAVEPSRVAARSRGPAGKWQDLSWANLDARRRAVAGGLGSLGVKRGDVVAIVAANSPEMMIAEFAALTLGATVAPIFPAYAPRVLLHCLADSGARVALTGNAAQQHQLAQARQLERIVVLDDRPLPDDDRGLALKALEAPGSHAAVDARSDDIAFLLYTSGTTGNPKGVELTHHNALSQQAALSQVWDVSERDVFLSYLPWHHCFGSLFERLMALWHRAPLAIDDSRGRDLDRMIQNLLEIKPTVFFSVPRVYNALVARAQKDRQVRDAFRRLRFAFSAAAPISEPAFAWFEENGVPLLEGWGLTETSPCATVTRPEDSRAPGMVGHPIPGTALKLEPVEGFPGRGEILVRGPQVMRGYRNRPEETRKVMEGGWLRSGDLGEWTENGLQLFGRIDAVFKLANGEKVSAGEVEARMLAATPLLDQAVVLGSGQPYVTALCWISQGVARRWLEERHLDVPDDFAGLNQVPELRRAIVEALQAANLLASLHYERFRRVALVPEAPALETGELTPTLKMVRAVSSVRHAALIAAMAENRPHPQVLEISRRGDPFGPA
jgi:long-subunit acyl-CoA synthetase (AMP-forming)